MFKQAGVLVALGVMVVSMVTAVGQTAKAELIANPLDSMHKVLRDDPAPDWIRFGALPAKPWEQVALYEPLEAARMKTARVSLARNEFEAVQIVLRATGGDSADVKIDIGELRDTKTGSVFPSSDITMWQESYVEVFSLWNSEQQLGWWPDPLIPMTSETGLNVKSGQNQPVLLRFHTKENTSPGKYRGKITVRADGQKDLILPPRFRAK